MSMSREEWVAFMRKELCPPEIVDEDGGLRVEYFEPRTSAVDGVEWKEEDVDLLICGIQEFGIGCWSEIKQKHLPLWDEIGIRLKSSLLLGTQNLDAYTGWKGGKEEMEGILQKNRSSSGEKWAIGAVPDPAFGLLVGQQ